MNIFVLVFAILFGAGDDPPRQIVWAKPMHSMTECLAWKYQHEHLMPRTANAIAEHYVCTRLNKGVGHE